MSESIETKGKTVDLAVSEALLQLGLRRDEVDIKVLDEPKGGILGLFGARQARVLVSKRAPGRGRGGRRPGGDDHRAHDLTANRSSGREQSRGGGRDGGRNADNRGGNRDGGGRNGGRNADTRGGGREGGRPDAGNEQRAAAPTAGPAAGERGDGRQDEQGGGQRSRRRRGGRGRGGRGRSGQGAPVVEQAQGGENGAPMNPVADRPARGTRDGRSGRSGGRHDRSGRMPRSGRPDGDRPRDEAPREERPRGENPGNEIPRAEQVRRDVAPTPAPVARESRPEMAAHDETPRTPAAATESVRPRVDAAVVPPESAAPAAPARAKTRAWGGLGARRARPVVDKPLGTVDEISPATAGAVFKPTRKAARAAAERLATQEAKANEVEAPRSSPARSSGFGGGSSSARAGGQDQIIASGIAVTNYAKPALAVSADDQPALLTELASGVFARAGFPCECETVPGEYHAVKVQSDEDGAGLLIGRYGETAEAIEHLIERMASNATGDRVRMNLDINDYRNRREEELLARVLDAVAQVRATGEPHHMESMEARERRIVHMATADLEGITTFTVVDRGGKHVVIAGDEGAGNNGGSPSGEGSRDD